MTTPYRKPEQGLIEQTALLREVELPEVSAREGEDVSVTFAVYPWLMVLNQDCDLLFDRLARHGLPLKEGQRPVRKGKLLRSILLCPAFPLDHVFAGTYIPEAREWRGNEKKILEGNRDERYHVLPVEGSVPAALALDFKLVLSASPEYMWEWVTNYPERVVAVLCPPFRDRLMQRFVGYLGRIALPGEE